MMSINASFLRCRKRPLPRMRTCEAALRRQQVAPRLLTSTAGCDNKKRHGDQLAFVFFVFCLPAPLPLCTFTASGAFAAATFASGADGSRSRQHLKISDRSRWRRWWWWGWGGAGEWEDASSKVTQEGGHAQ